MTATLAPLLGGLFLILVVGVLLRLLRGPDGARMGGRDADTLNRLIIDVTMPALLVHVLAARDLVWGAGAALAGTTTAFFACLALGVVVARLAGEKERKAQGSAGLVASFSNTGFLGFPLLLQLFPGDETASSTALLVDTLNTTLLMWTVGLAFATRMGHGGAFDGKTMARMLVRPITLAIALGLGLRAFHVELPGFVDDALAATGACTSPLVFLALGLQLDVGALKGRALPVGAVTLVKLVVAPLLCLLVVRLLSLAEPIASVAVLQSAMPSAMASVIVAAQTGCDRAFAAGVATLSALLCLLSLPAVGLLLDATR